MRMQIIYTDTSVFGGVFDDEFAISSRQFFMLVQHGRFELMVSDITRREIAVAPTKVQLLFNEILPYMRNRAINEEILQLRDAFVSAGIVDEKWADDAGHVAAAIVGEADLIVSWNFKHIVHFDKIRLFSAVNTEFGYKPLQIFSPREVTTYGHG